MVDIRERIADTIRDIRELPDYQSPDDQPDLVMCTVEELQIILERNFAVLAELRKDAEPVAWLHTLHMEGGQTYDRLLAWNGVDEDEPRRNAFGFPGSDYSEEYEVTSTPLFAHLPVPPVQAQCIGCEGSPAPENNPCVVCGRTAQPQPDPMKELQRLGQEFDASDAPDFLGTIHERTPNGEWIAVQHHPNGDWSVAHNPQPDQRGKALEEAARIAEQFAAEAQATIDGKEGKYSDISLTAVAGNVAGANYVATAIRALIDQPRETTP